jgi:hypothetical protein
MMTARASRSFSRHSFAYVLEAGKRVPYLQLRDVEEGKHSGVVGSGVETESLAAGIV